MISPSPVLITGSHRSGTSWVGQMLCACGEFGYLHEPFSNAEPGWLSKRFPYTFQYVCRENAEHYEPTLQRVLTMRYPLLAQLSRLRTVRSAAALGRDGLLSFSYRVRRVRPLLVDPMAVFSAEWLAARFNLQVVVMIRHPAAFVECLKRLGWTFEFKNFLQQDLLMRDYLSPFEREIRQFAASEQDIIDQAILLWNAVYSVVRLYQQRHPSWLFVKFEELACEPVSGFRGLYQRLGLSWNERVEAAVVESSHPGNPIGIPAGGKETGKRNSRAVASLWQQRLTPAEVRRVRAGVQQVAGGFYTEDDWTVAEGQESPEMMAAGAS